MSCATSGPSFPPLLCVSELTELSRRDNIYLIKTLKEFQHTDENGVDVGIIVREKATALTSLLIDKERLKRERGGSARDSRLLSRHVEDPTPTHARNRSMSQPLPRPSPAESARKRREAQLEKDKRELADAMAASKEDEAKRQRLLRSQAGDGVFNDLRQSKECVLSPLLPPFPD